MWFLYLYPVPVPVPVPVPLLLTRLGFMQLGYMQLQQIRVGHICRSAMAHVLIDQTESES